jgi:hypothetical protein
MMTRTAERTENGTYRPLFPGAEEIMRDLLGGGDGGWDGLAQRPGAEHLMEARARPNEELRRCYAQVYGTDAGRRVIEDLLNQTLRRSPYSTDPAFSLDQQAAFGLVRQGQTTLMVHILAMIADGQALPNTAAKKARKKS